MAGRPSIFWIACILLPAEKYGLERLPSSSVWGGDPVHVIVRSDSKGVSINCAKPGREEKRGWRPSLPSPSGLVPPFCSLTTSKQLFVYSLDGRRCSQHGDRPPTLSFLGEKLPIPQERHSWGMEESSYHHPLSHIQSCSHTHTGPERDYWSLGEFNWREWEGREMD